MGCRPHPMPGGPTDAAWTAAELRAAKARAKWRPSKHTDERRCTATTRAGAQCKAPRAKRQDGTLATVCRMHGDHGPMTLEAQARSLERLVKWRSAQLRGAETKLAAVLQAIERERVIGLGRVPIGTESLGVSGGNIGESSDL